MFIFAQGFAVISNMICIFFLLNKVDFSAFIGRYWIRAEDIKKWERKMLKFHDVIFELIHAIVVYL